MASDDRQMLQELEELDALQARARASEGSGMGELKKLNEAQKGSAPGLAGAAVTGLARGVAGVGDLVNPISKLVNTASEAFGGPKFPTPTGALKTIEPYLHEPTGTAENVVSAGASALPYSLGGGPYAALLNVLGAGAGEVATKAPLFAGMPPELARLVGTLGAPLGGQILRSTPALLGAVPGVKQIAKALMGSMETEGGSPIFQKPGPLAGPTPTAQQIYENSLTGSVPREELLKQALANQERLWGSSGDQRSISQKLAEALLKLGQRFVLNPAMQASINEGQ